MYVSLNKIRDFTLDNDTKTKKMNTNTLLIIGIGYILPTITLTLALIQKRINSIPWLLFTPILNWLILILATQDSIKEKRKYMDTVFLRDNVRVRIEKGKIEKIFITSFDKFKNPERRQYMQVVPNYWYWSVSFLVFVFIQIMRKTMKI